MTFHLLAYQGSGAASAETTLTPITDQVMQTNDNGFFSNQALQMIGSILLGADTQYGLINMPSLNCLGYDHITQIVTNTAGNDGDSDFVLRKDNPLNLRARERIQLVGFQDNVAAQDITGGLLVTTGLVPTSGSGMFTIRGTSTEAAVADTWTMLNDINWVVNLPAGDYQCVGGRVEAANGFFWRVNAQDCDFRPGYLINELAGDLDNPLMRYGGLGEWCKFDNNLMPEIEVLCSAATASFVIYLDVIQL